MGERKWAKKRKKEQKKKHGYMLSLSNCCAKSKADFQVYDMDQVGTGSSSETGDQEIFNSNILMSSLRPQDVDFPLSLTHHGNRKSIYVRKKLGQTRPARLITLTVTSQ